MNVDYIGFGPDDIFREYHWNGPWRTIDCPYLKWQRVTDPDTQELRAQKYLPNPVNVLYVDDLGLATKAELCIEQWSGHPGTSEKNVRINEHEWIEIPESSQIGPEPPETYEYFRYPIIPIPLEQIHEGNNDFQFTCGNQIAHKIAGVGWGQWGVYGVTLRVYYSQEKPHPEGTIIVPTSGLQVGDQVVLQFTPVAGGTSEHVDRVDFLGYYEDFDHNGDGVYEEWHYRYRYGQLKNHVGTVLSVPFKVTWDASWVPDQERPIKIMARVTDYNGVSWITSIVEHSQRVHDYSVKLYKPYDIPPHWSTRAGAKQFCKVDIPDNVENAVAAQLMLSTWNGFGVTDMGVNDTKLLERVGRNHDFSYDEIEIPVTCLKYRTNTIYTASTTEHHGIDVHWPGIALKVKYQ